jgi:hypothetical protein
MKTEFEKKIVELGFSYQCNTDGVYVLSHNNDTNSMLTAQLICSEPVDESQLGSRNGNAIQSIGHFKIKLLNEVKEPYFLILAFQNTINHIVEFIIIPKIELMRRLNKENRISKASHKISIVFWLMPDNCLYDCTNIGVEGEWFYMSKGPNGRVADDTDWDHSDFLNAWDKLKPD